MLTLNDGRSELWQWDTGRTLTVDVECSQVHFSNKVFGRSIDVDVIDGVATIPDILLQTDKELTAWAFVGTAENGYTKTSKTFKVNRKNKPADYVFTPPEQTTLGEILNRIEDLEKRPSGGNGGITKEVDPTVPDWAKQPQKPTYTAADVGALSQNQLQSGINTALEQAKTSGEFDGADGRDGADGKDGYTPAKGIDYFTPEDVQEIAQQAAGLVEVPSGGSNEKAAEALLGTIVIAAKTAAGTALDTGVTLADLKKYKRFVIGFKGVSNTNLSNTYAFLDALGTGSPYNNKPVFRCMYAGWTAGFEWLNADKTLLRCYAAFMGNPSLVSLTNTIVYENAVANFPDGISGPSGLFILNVGSIPDTTPLKIYLTNEPTVDYTAFVRGVTV